MPDIDLSQELPPLVTIPQVAKLLHRSKRTVYEYINSGLLNPTRPCGGRKQLIPRAELERVLSEGINA